MISEETISMKKIKFLTVAAALMVPVWIASAAAAGPPDCWDRPEDHPLWCEPPTSSSTTTSTTTPDGGGSCAATADQGHQVFIAEDGFDVWVDPGTTGCVDWTTTIATEWLVTVEPGNANSVYFNVRGSHPGDFCWLDALDTKSLDGGQGMLTITHSNGPLGDGDALPIATVGACGPADDVEPSFVFTVGPRGKPSPVHVTVTAIPAG